MVATGDLDGDGDPDLVVTGRGTDGLAFVLFNESADLLGEPQPVEVGTQSDAVEIADLDADGDMDLVVAVRSLRGRLAVLEGRGDGTFASRWSFASDASPETSSSSISTATATSTSPGSTIGSRPSISSATGARCSSIPPLDRLRRRVDRHPVPAGHGTRRRRRGRGRGPRVVCTGESRVHVAMNRGDGTFDPLGGWLPVRVAGEIGGMGDLVLGDLDLDGDVDALPLILIDSTSHVGVYENTTGTGDERVELARDVAASTETNGYAFAVDLADLDGDGDLDVIVGHALPGPLVVLDNRTAPESDGGDGVIRFEPPQVVALDNFFRGIASVGPRWRLRHRRHGPRSRLERDLDPLERDAAGGGLSRGTRRFRALGRGGDHDEDGTGSDRSVAARGSRRRRSDRRRRSRPMLGNWGGGTSSASRNRLAGTRCPLARGVSVKRRSLHLLLILPLLVPGVALAGDCGPGLPPCDEPHEGAGCLQPQCCELVCENDVFCCETQWDQTCADLAADLCVDVRCPQEGDCFEVRDTPGCIDEDCCELVQLHDPFCGFGTWDEFCLEGALEWCGGSPRCPIEPGPGAIDEMESCLDRINDGCPSDGSGRSTTTLACGDVVFGKSTTSIPRDVDAFVLDLVPGSGLGHPSFGVPGTPRAGRRRLRRPAAP